MMGYEQQLGQDLATLWNQQGETYALVAQVPGVPAEPTVMAWGPSLRTMLAFPHIGGMGQHLGNYVATVRDVAGRNGCTAFTITLGFPWGVSASFTFAVPRDDTVSTARTL